VTGDGPFRQLDELAPWLREAAAPLLVPASQMEPAWRVSLRSKGAVDVSAVAVAFRGGGHRRAAGFTHAATARETMALIRRRLEP